MVIGENVHINSTYSADSHEQPLCFVFLGNMYTQYSFLSKHPGWYIFLVSTCVRILHSVPSSCTPRQPVLTYIKYCISDEKYRFSMTSRYLQYRSCLTLYIQICSMYSTYPVICKHVRDHIHIHHTPVHKYISTIYKCKVHNPVGMYVYRYIMIYICMYVCTYVYNTYIRTYAMYLH